MSSIIPFDGSAKLPAYLTKFREQAPSINSDVVGAASFPHISIKGKVFTLVKDGERKVLRREIDGELVPRSSVPLVTVRANTKARTYFSKQYVEGENAIPDCQSFDGIAPTAQSPNKQATKCAICPHAAWGTGSDKGTGTACSKVTLLAVKDPENPGMNLMLRVPPASRPSFTDACKQGQSRNIPYNALVLRVSFHPEAAMPQLVFTPTALVSDELYAQIEQEYASQEVLDMLGLNTQAAVEKAAAPAAPTVSKNELAAALGTSAKPKVTRATGTPKPTAPAPVVEEAPAPQAAPATTIVAGDAGDLLAGLDALLGGGTDD